MVGNHQLVFALSSPTQDQWAETMSLELARSQLFCLLSVVGEQAGNIGKELLELWHKQSVLSAEAVYSVLSQYLQTSTETGARISCAVVVFRGTRTTVATLRAGVSLRRADLAKVVIKASDGVEIREGSALAQDLYILYTELAGRQAEALLFQSKYPDQLLKQWQKTKVEMLESTIGSDGLGIGMVLPNQLLESRVGQGFIETEQSLDVDGHSSQSLPGGSKAGEKNLLQQRRASRQVEDGWRQRLSISLGLVSAKMLRKPDEKNGSSLDIQDGEKSLDIPTEELVSSQLQVIGEKSVNQPGSTENVVDKSTVTTRQSDPLPEESTIMPSRSTGGVLVASSESTEFDQKTQTTQSRGVNIANSAKNFGTRLKSRKSVFVGHHLSRKRLLIIIGSILLLVALLLGIGYLRHSRQVAEQVAMEQLLPYQAELENTRTLGESDPVSARAQAQSQLAELGRLQAEGNLPSTAQNELERLLNETKALYESLDVVSDLTALPLFDDLRRLSPSFLASTASGDGSQGILADESQQLLITYNATSKEGQVVDAATLEKVISVSQIAEQSYVLGDGVWSLNSPTATELSQVIQPATQTEGATLIATFGSNVYVFNPTQRALFRYASSGSTFGSPTNWMTGAAPFTFTDVTSVVVDGEVWFGTKQGQVYRFVGGKQIDFSLTNLEQPLSTTLYLATDDESDVMAVLEPAGKRLVLFSKDSGQVIREFVNPNLGAATGLWLDEANNQVLISSGAALYAIQITDSAP